MDNFLKIPCILVVAAAVHINNTQPSATPKVVNQPSTTTSGNKLINRMVLSGFFLPVLKGTFWMIAFMEIITIILPPILRDLSITTPPILHVGLHNTVPSVVGFFSALLGVSLRLICYRTLQKFHTFHLCIVEDHKLVTTGPYGIVRHPSYVGALMISTGMTFWYFAPGSILMEVGGGTIFGKGLCVIGFVYLATVCWAIPGRIMSEDKLLKSTFGEAWDNWARSVPYALVPGLY